MKFCPITLQEIQYGEAFSNEGLQSFHPRLQDLAQLELSNEEQLSQARLRADKRSIQGVQPKLSARLRVKKGKFDIVDQLTAMFAREHEVITIDGARVIFEEGWGVVRASNTEPRLTLRFEADTDTALAEIMDRFRRAVEEVGLEATF